MELDSAQCDTARNFGKLEYRGENETKNEKNILTHLSVALGGSKMKKTRSQKSRWTVPLIKDYYNMLLPFCI